MDFAVAGVCGQMKDPSGRASMAKGKGLDELLAGMVAVCALKPDVASFMYEPTFIMTSARLTGKDVIAATERALMYVGDLAIGPNLGEEAVTFLHSVKDLEKQLQLRGVLDQRRVLGGVASCYMDDLAYGVTAVLAGAMARLNRGAFVRTYKAFAVQYGDTQDASTLLGGGGKRFPVSPSA